MKRIIHILVVLSLMLIVASGTAFAHTDDDPFITDLVVGGGNIKSAKDIGDVLVWNDGDYLYVNYLVTDWEWCLTSTHLEVAASLIDIPQTKKGSPIPGKFTYGGSHECLANVEYSIPLNSWAPGTELLIAAHGVAHTGGMGGFELMLPAQVTYAATHPGLGFGAPSYFDVTISGGTTLDGMYDGYCIDIHSGYTSPATADVYSSYEPLPLGIINYPENLDLVNWIINQGFEGQPSLGCVGNYTYGDVQAAIWTLLEGSVNDNGSLGAWSPCRVDEILAAAYANGEGFVPGCGEKLGVILIPELFVIDDFYSYQHQSLLIWVDAPCDGESETAWGGDYFGTPLEFPGKDWSIYFSYTVQ